MFAERLAVIGRNRHDRRSSGVTERVDETPELAVRFGDFVGIAQVRRAPAAGIAVRSMWFEQVHPQKEPLRTAVFQPLERSIDDRAAGPFICRPAARIAWHLIVIGLKALDQS